MFEKMQHGWVEVICGSMFSGKSEELIRRVRRATYANLNIKVFKPAIDDRYAKESVVSHNGSEAEAIPVLGARGILDQTAAELSQLDLVAVDEAQFFDDDLIETVNHLADNGIRVILAGLDTDFRGEPFGPMPKLMTIAESVTKLTAICPKCGSPASRTQRLIDGKPASYHEPVILVGASESYEPRCRHHHEVPDKPKRASAQTENIVK